MRGSFIAATSANFTVSTSLDEIVSYQHIISSNLSTMLRSLFYENIIKFLPLKGKFSPFRMITSSSSLQYIQLLREHKLKWISQWVRKLFLKQQAIMHKLIKRNQKRVATVCILQTKVKGWTFIKMKYDHCTALENHVPHIDHYVS